MTHPPRRELPSWVAEVPLAHRGLWDEQRPENSLAAFAAARDAGCGVELDVHLTLDGVPVVLHDHDLARTAGAPIAVQTITRDELREHTLADGSPVPTLAEALDELGDTPVMVEIKNMARGAGLVEPPTAEVLDAHLRRDGARAYVASFHPGSLRWFRRHRPDVMRAQTASAAWDPQLPRVVGHALAWTALNGRSLPHLLSYDVAGLHHPAVRRWRARGGVVLTWTVRTPQLLDAATGAADNIIFEGFGVVPSWPASGRPPTG